MARVINRQQDILKQAARLFRERGFLATSIRDIGEAVGISSAALYYHYKNKEELLREVVCEGVRLVHIAVAAAVDGEAELLDKIRTGMRAHVLTSLQHLDFSAVIIQEMRYLGPDDRQLAVDVRDRYEAFWAELGEEAVRRGVLRPGVDAALARFFALGAMNWITTWYHPEGAYTPEQIADSLFDFFALGVLRLDAR